MKTRMERYKELREKMSNEVETKVQSQGLSEYANRLNKIDQNNFDNMEVESNPDYKPTRAKDVEVDMYETFENEYLKDFLEEVKSYNIEKGTRVVSDTKENILENINAPESQVNGKLGTSEDPIGLEDIGIFDNIKQPVTNREEIDTSAMDFLNKTAEIKYEDDIFSNVVSDLLEEPIAVQENVEVVASEDTPADDFGFNDMFNTPSEESEPAMPVFEPSEVLFDETENTDELFDTESIINALTNDNFFSEKVTEPEASIEDGLLDTSQFQTFDLELEQRNKEHTDEIFQNVDDTFFDGLNFGENINKVENQVEYSENNDPFWTDYIQKMNELEDNIDAVYEGPRDNLNFPESRPEPIQTRRPEPVESRDITQEFLELTREIERDNLESIDLGSQVSEPVVETVEEIETVRVEEIPVTVEKQISKNIEFTETAEMDDAQDLYTPSKKETTKNRAINALLTVALAGIILGVAIAVKYFLFN